MKALTPVGELNRAVSSTEIWRPVVGFEGLYEVSSRGRIRSRPRPGTNGGVLKPNKTTKGYPKADLSSGGEITTRLIHRLVLEAFVGACPDGMEACHNDGVKANNRLKNLRWDTPASNYADRDQHGMTARGDKHGNIVLCELDVWLIRNCNGSQQQLADFLGVSQVHVGRIRRAESWAHI